MPGQSQIRQSNSGIALFAALVMLVVFAMLGSAYVKYMTLDLENTRFEVQKLRSEHLGQSGVYAAIGEIEAARSKNERPLTTYEFGLPVYRTEQQDDGTLGRTEFPQYVVANVRDESGRVNLNHAPGPILEALGIPASVIRERQASDFRFFVSVDDLRARDFMNSQEFDALDLDLLTVFSGDRRGADINLNSADPKVLEAIFNIDPQEAATLASKRPFTSWRDVVRKIGREPSSFRVSSAQPDELPEGLSLKGACFRISSSASMQTPDTSRRGMQVNVEAVVNFNDEGFSIRYWNPDPPEVLEFGPDTITAEELDAMIDEPEAAEAEDESEDSEDSVDSGESDTAEDAESAADSE